MTEANGIMIKLPMMVNHGRTSRAKSSKMTSISGPISAISTLCIRLRILICGTILGPLNCAEAFSIFTLLFSLCCPGFSAQFFTDYLLAILLSIALWLLPADNSTMPGFSSKGLTVFREVADLTFPIYVLHYPLLILYRAVFGFQENNLRQFIIAVLLVFTLSAVIGYGLNKSRRYWNSLFGYFLSYVKRMMDTISRRFSMATM